MLENNKSIVEVSFYNCSIGKEGVVAVAGMLEKNSVIKDLSLDGNNIGDDAAGVLAESLKHNTTLTSLGLMGMDEHTDSITDLGMWWDFIVLCSSSCVDAVTDNRCRGTAVCCLPDGESITYVAQDAWQFCECSDDCRY
jgi:hypothetical protein